jgi:hypothetical protein
MTTDDIITAVTQAATYGEARAVMEGVRSSQALAALCDQLHIDADGHGKAWQRIAIVTEARA